MGFGRFYRQMRAFEAAGVRPTPGRRRALKLGDDAGRSAVAGHQPLDGVHVEHTAVVEDGDAVAEALGLFHVVGRCR